jgi:hypothetical protein
MHAVVEAWATEASELLEIWQRVSSRHVSLGTSCACGIGGVTLQLQDFEQDILDFVIGQAERSKRTDVIAYVRESAFDVQRGRGSVEHLLKTLSRGDTQGLGEADVPIFVLGKLGKTLRSFARLHG